ncbi:MAG: glycosyltransferase family 2 protein [Chitinophagaceae bacterium]
MTIENLKLSVVICSYNRAKYIANAMESLYNQTIDKSLYEVFVVDNNSTDNTKEICQNYITKNTDFNISYIEEKRQGATYARNTGAALAKGKYLVFMDDDAEANVDFLERILLFFKNNPNADGVGGRIIPLYIPEEPKWMSYYVSSLVGNFDYSNTVKEFAPEKFPLESNMVTPKQLFDEVGGFDENLLGVVGTLRIGGESKGYHIKLQKMGKKIYYDPTIIVRHVIETEKLTRAYMYRVASGIGRGERARTLAIGYWSFIKKNMEYFVKWGASIILAIKYILKGNPSQALPIIQFRNDAFLGLWGK